MASRPSPRRELQTLKRFVAEIEAKFLAKHLAARTLNPPGRQEELDVAAFAVLAHGAMENFVEGIGLWALGEMEQNWINKKRATRCIASLLLYQAVPTDEMVPGMSVFDNIRIQIGKAKSETSKQIEQNNGITARHLIALFRPLGIDVPADPVLTASLEALVKLRHRWAHQYRFGAQVLKSAADVKQTATDCVRLAELLAVEALNVRP